MGFYSAVKNDIKELVVPAWPTHSADIKQVKTFFTINIGKTTEAANKAGLKFACQLQDSRIQQYMNQKFDPNEP